jgi:hypothetical protein
MLVGVAIVGAAFPLNDRFFRRFLAWCGCPFEALSIFAVGVRCNWYRRISCFRCGVLSQILYFAYCRAVLAFENRAVTFL